MLVAQTGIEPVASRSQSEPSTADLLRYFAAVLAHCPPIKVTNAVLTCDNANIRLFSFRANQVVGKMCALVEKETGKLLPRGLPPRPTHAALAAGFDLYDFCFASHASAQASAGLSFAAMGKIYCGS